MIRKFTVKPVLNGYIVEIGCQTIVFHSKKRFLKEVEMYLDNPDGRERYWLKHGVNSGVGSGECRELLLDASGLISTDPEQTPARLSFGIDRLRTDSDDPNAVCA